MSPSPRHWSELSSLQRNAILAVATVQVGLQAAVLVDLRRRPPSRVRGDKRAWVTASFVNLAGPIAYLLRARR